MELTSFVEIVTWILGCGEHAQAVPPKALMKEMTGVVRKIGTAFIGEMSGGVPG
jgi:hypothetical protein